MLFVSIVTSDRERDPELWAVIWNAKAPPTLKLHGAYNLSDNRRVFVWEGESAADLRFMDRFNQVGMIETTPAFDRTTGWQYAFQQDLESFRSMTSTGPAAASRPANQHSDRAVELRRRGIEAPTVEAAKEAARRWQAEQAGA